MKACYNSVSSKHVNESCNKDHKALSRWSFVWLDIAVMVPQRGYTRQVIFFIKEVPVFCMVSRILQKTSYKSDMRLVLLNNQRIKWHVKHFLAQHLAVLQARLCVMCYLCWSSESWNRTNRTNADHFNEFLLGWCHIMYNCSLEANERYASRVKLKLMHFMVVSALAGLH